MIIGLSIRLGISHAEIETWTLPTIREYLAALREANRPAEQGPEEQTPEEVERGLMAAFGKPPSE